MFLERRLERLIEKLRQSAAISLRLELWNGRAFDLATQPKVKIGVPGPSALRFLVSPDLMKLGQAYVEGTLRVEGPILEVFRVAESLARAAASRGRSGLRRVWRHTRRRDRDKIASVGMFEHVGLRHLKAYFAKIRTLLAEGGLVMNHGITSSDPDSRWVGMGAGEFVQRYVFPHGELPHLSLVLREMAGAGLEVADVESLRRHYARTCLEWAKRLEQNRERAITAAGDKRYRIWQVYLAGCAHGFQNEWMNVYQVLARREGETSNPLPPTRDYMYRAG